MWVKQCHKPPVWEWFIQPVYGDLGGGLLLFYQYKPIYSLWFITWNSPSGMTVDDRPKSQPLQNKPKYGEQWPETTEMELWRFWKRGRSDCHWVNTAKNLSNSM